MTSSPMDHEDADDTYGAAPGASGRRSPQARAWTRQWHNYLGLFLLLFLWMFSVSGLVLNHSTWSAGRFWEERNEVTTRHTVQPPATKVDIAMAVDLMRQLKIVGEVGDTRRHPDGARFEFQIVKPGQVFRVEARTDSGLARVTAIRVNAWGVVDALHKFTGMKMGEPDETRDWLLTRIWSFAMDALALGMVILVGSGIYLWLRRREARRPGLAALLGGGVCCAFFFFGLGVLVA